MISLSFALIYSTTCIVLTEAEYIRAETIYDKSRSESFHILETAQEASALNEAEEFFPAVQVDFERLKKTNVEIVGWIWIPETNINFPLLLAKDNWKYLSLSYNLQQTNSGSIFMDFRSSPDFTDDNTVIYGHNMKSGGMFGELKEFSNSDYLVQHCDLYIFTEERVFKYRIFAAYKTECDSKSYTLDFSEDFGFDGFIKYVTSCASGADMPEERTTLVTLSTCTSARMTERFVVHAFFVAEKNVEPDEPLPTGATP